jgi:cob(I)alamin adenosyltransferase
MHAERQFTPQTEALLSSVRQVAGTWPTILANTEGYNMGNRLTQIATRTGDNGTTGLGNNQRVSKNSLRVHAMGEVDELNSHIGLLLCEDMPVDVRELLVEVQHQLFNLGGELSIPGFELLKVEAVAALDDALEKYNAQLPKLEEFILPAGTRGASQAHVCRTVARRAERACVALGNEEALNDTPRQYLNRLSDLMFVLARVLNRLNGGDDVYWKSQRMNQDDKPNAAA